MAALKQHFFILTSLMWIRLDSRVWALSCWLHVGFRPAACVSFWGPGWSSVVAEACFSHSRSPELNGLPQVHEHISNMLMLCPLVSYKSEEDIWPSSKTRGSSISLATALRKAVARVKHIILLQRCRKLCPINQSPFLDHSRLCLIL